jgi:hypothetical protein
VTTLRRSMLDGHAKRDHPPWGHAVGCVALVEGLLRRPVHRTDRHR